jgi:hypothetical protein
VALTRSKPRITRKKDFGCDWGEKGAFNIQIVSDGYDDGEKVTAASTK